jgi:hypothetical protein
MAPVACRGIEPVVGRATAAVAGRGIAPVLPPAAAAGLGMAPVFVPPGAAGRGTGPVGLAGGGINRTPQDWAYFVFFVTFVAMRIAVSLFQCASVP